MSNLGWRVHNGRDVTFRVMVKPFPHGLVRVQFLPAAGALFMTQGEWDALRGALMITAHADFYFDVEGE